MNPPSDRQVVPTSGANVYDYSESNLAQVSLRTWIIGLGITLFTVFVGTGIVFKVAPVKGLDNPLVLSLLLVVFLTVGVSMFVWGLHLYLTSKRAELVLYPDGFISRDGYGRSSARIPYSHVLRCSVNTWNKPYYRSWIDSQRHRHMSPTHFKVSLVTAAGTFTFYDDISGWSKLRDYFLSIQAAPTAEGVFRFWDLTWFTVGVVLIPLTSMFAVDLVNDYRVGEIIKINRQPTPMPLWFLCLFLAVTAIFFCFGFYQVLSSLLERIVVSNGRVVSYNWFGWPTVNARLDQIEHGSFQKYSSGVRSIQTLKGEISWGWGISNYSTLNAIMQKASAESKLGNEAEEPIVKGLLNH